MGDRKGKWGWEIYDQFSNCVVAVDYEAKDHEDCHQGNYYSFYLVASEERSFLDYFRR